MLQRKNESRNDQHTVRYPPHPFSANAVILSKNSPNTDLRFSLSTGQLIFALLLNIQTKTPNDMKHKAYIRNDSLGETSIVASRTTPKIPPPPPRSAKNRSWFWQALAVRNTPSGVTILYCSCITRDRQLAHHSRWNGRTHCTVGTHPIVRG